MGRVEWLLLASLLCGCKPGAGEPCDFRKQDCGGELICVKRGKGQSITATCMTQQQADEGCTKDKLCRLSGACSYTTKATGICAPLSDEDCGKSQACTRFGRCTVRDHMCVVQTDDDCAGSEMCKKYGRCKAQPTKRLGRCIEAEPEAKPAPTAAASVAPTAEATAVPAPAATP